MNLTSNNHSTSNKKALLDSSWSHKIPVKGYENATLKVYPYPLYSPHTTLNVVPVPWITLSIHYLSIYWPRLQSLPHLYTETKYFKRDGLLKIFPWHGFCVRRKFHAQCNNIIVTIIRGNLFMFVYFNMLYFFNSRWRCMRVKCICTSFLPLWNT